MSTPDRLRRMGLSHLVDKSEELAQNTAQLGHWALTHWRAIASSAIAFIGGYAIRHSVGFFDRTGTPLPANHVPWEWGWDALVAIGTLALAFTTAIAVIIPLRTEQRRKREEATRLATLFDHELHVLCGLMVARAESTTDEFRTPQGYRLALKTIYEVHRIIGVPNLERSVAQLGVFDVKIAMDLGAVVTGVMQIQRNAFPSDYLEPQNVSYEVALNSIAAVFDESVMLAVRVHRVRASIQPIINAVVRMPELRPLPDWIVREYREMMNDHRRALGLVEQSKPTPKQPQKPR